MPKIREYGHSVSNTVVTIGKAPAVIDGNVTAPLKPGRLNSLRGSRLLHTRLVRAVCAGSISPTEASKISFILKNHTGILELEETTRRMAEIEKMLADRGE